MGKKDGAFEFSNEPDVGKKRVSPPDGLTKPFLAKNDSAPNFSIRLQGSQKLPEENRKPALAGLTQDFGAKAGRFWARRRRLGFL